MLSRQTINIADVWKDSETCSNPLVKIIYDARQDYEIPEIVSELKNQKDAKALLLHGAWIAEAEALPCLPVFGPQIAIPKSMVDKIMPLEHDVPVKGHPGESIVRLGVKQHFWWNNMDEDISNYVSTYWVYQLEKASNSPRATNEQPN